MIKLYGVPRSRALRSLWMLEELGVPYENVKTPFTRGATRTPEFLAIHPNGHIPALDDDGVLLFESLAINLYLARKYDRGLWPQTVADEGRAFQWSVWTPMAGLDLVGHRHAEEWLERCTSRPALGRAQGVSC